mgnify:CR=1 FL=1
MFLSSEARPFSVEASSLSTFAPRAPLKPHSSSLSTSAKDEDGALAARRDTVVSVSDVGASWC